MRWRGRRESTNVVDRRSAGGGLGRGGGNFGLGRGRMRIPGFGRSRMARRAGGGGIGMVIVVVLIAWLMGINPLTLLLGGEPGGPRQPTGRVAETASPAGGLNDEQKRFVSVVLADTEDVWTGIFREAGARYEEPRLVLFSGQVQSACGFASAASGPFYCPGDKRVYIDLSFYEELRERFAAPGDFAQAYVIAHEIGHHIQNLTGVLPAFNRQRAQMSQSEQNRMSVKIELQADCLAGVWGYHARDRGLLEEGDLEEALNAASQIGDDAIQRRTQGYVVPESFNHGTSEQRRRWFRVGYDSGDMGACDP